MPAGVVNFPAAAWLTPARGHLIRLEVVGWMARPAAPAVGAPRFLHQRVPKQQLHHPPGGGGSAVDELGGCWRLVAPGSLIHRVTPPEPHPKAAQHGFGTCSGAGEPLARHPNPCRSHHVL